MPEQTRVDCGLLSHQPGTNENVKKASSIRQERACCVDITLHSHSLETERVITIGTGQKKGGKERRDLGAYKVKLLRSNTERAVRDKPSRRLGLKEKAFDHLGMP